MLKALFISVFENADVPKTHDLALLADMLSEKFEIDEFIYNACSDLTPYDVKIRYPKEISVDVYTESITAKSFKRGTFIQLEIVPFPIPIFQLKSSKFVSKSGLKLGTVLKEESIQKSSRLPVQLHILAVFYKFYFKVI